MTSLRLYLLGSPRLERDGVPLVLDTRKNTALLAYLAITGVAHSREALATFLWPDSAPAQSRAILRRNLSVLSRTLDEGWLVVDRQTIGLHPPAEAWLDVAEFRRLAQGWRHHGHGAQETCPHCLSDLAAAAALYREDFMAGFSLGDSPSFDDWQSFQTELMRQELTAVLAKLVQGLADRGEVAAAIPHAQRWAAFEPLHEPAQRQLIQLLSASGNRSAALRQYDRYVKALQDELGIQPDDETRALVDDIRRGMVRPGVPAEPGTAWPDARAPGRRYADPAAIERQDERIRHNLPSPVTPFIGRERELSDLARIIQDRQARLVTIVAPGGMGKTRLVIEAAWRLLSSFTDGVWLVELAPLQTAEHILPAIRGALGLEFHSRQDHGDQLVEYLRDKQLLLVLDNIEDLNDADGVLLALLRAAPGLILLVTSHQRLGLARETAYPIGGLPLGDAKLQAVAAEIFVQAARRVRVDFSPSAAEMEHVVRICRLVDGMPLGIILAASWMDTLSLEEIADNIAASVDFLSAELADIPRRQWSIRAVFDSMWQRLSTQEQDAYRRMSVFRGGFSREAAQAVTGADLAVLRSLINRSLINRDAQGRLNTHNLLRQYAREQLVADGASAEAYRAHAETYLALAKEYVQHLRGPEQALWLSRLQIEEDNLRAALSWSLSGADVALGAELTAALALFWRRRSRFQEADSAAQRAIAQLATEPNRLALPLHLLLGDVYEPLARYDAAATHYGAGLGMATALDDPLSQVLALTGLSRVAWRHGDYSQAEGHALRALHIAESAQHEFALARADYCLGVVRSHQGRYAEAEELYLRSLAISQATGNVRGAAHALLELGWSASARGEYDRARSYLARSLETTQALGSLADVAAAQSTLGWIADSQGEPDHALEHYRQALVLYDRLGHRFGQANTLTNLAFVLLDQEQTDEAHAMLLAALQLAHEMGDTPIAFEALIGLARCRFQSGQTKESAVLAGLVGQQPGLNSQVRGHRLEPLCAELQNALPPDELGMLMKKDTAYSVDMAIQHILHENACASSLQGSRSRDLLDPKLKQRIE